MRTFTAMSLLKEMESSVSDLDVSHSPFGWTKSYKIQVKGHPLAESSKVITKESGQNEEETPEEQLEDDEISPEEQGFMQGEEKAKEKKEGADLDDIARLLG